MKKKFKVGVIGLGVGAKHVEGYLKHRECEVVAVCDFSKEKMTAVAKLSPTIRMVKKAEDILKNPEIDIVSIATYDNYHFKQVMQALKNDKHVFVEKPLCLYPKEMKAIQKILKKKPRLKISSNLILRQSPRFQLLKKMIDQGKFGKIYHIDCDYNYGRLNKITHGWRGAIPFYSVVYGGSVHLIDLILWFTKDQAKEIVANGNNVSSRGSQYKYNDIINGLIKFKSGMTVKVTSNYSCVQPHFHGLTIYGTKATFVNGPDHGLLYTSRDPKVKPKRITAAYPGVHKGDLVGDFVEAIIRNREPAVSRDDVFNVMNICFGIEKALKKGPVLLSAK